MLDRKALVWAAALAAAAMPAAAHAAWDKPVHSVPGFRIPRVWTTVDDPSRSPGYIFLTPRVRAGQRTGPTMLDADGHVVWFHRLTRKRTAIGLRPQTYLGRPVLTWGQRPPLIDNGDFYTGTVHNVYNVIADQSYHTFARVRAHGRDVVTDLHEFEITKRNTALVLGSRYLHRNLRRYGGPRNGLVLDNIVQEVDIRTGRVLLNWSAARRLSPSGSMIKPRAKDGFWDPYHANSVSEDTDGNLLVTLRHFSSVLKLDRHDGRVLWELGGKHSNFKISRGAAFFYPHDAQRARDGTLTVFDNRSTLSDRSHGASRGLRLQVSAAKRTVTEVSSYSHPAGSTFAISQGNVEDLDGGGAFVGWGISPWFSEYAADGHLTFAGHFESIWNQSYRAFKADWIGRPKSSPAVVASTRTGRLVAYMSWNGETGVAQWRVLAGPSKDALTPLGTANRADFETRLSYPGTPAFVQVQALDASGAVLGSSAVIAPRTK